MKLINDNYGRVKKKSGNFQTVAPSKMQKTWSKLASKSLKCISNTPFKTEKVWNFVIFLLGVCIDDKTFKLRGEKGYETAVLIGGVR